MACAFHYCVEKRKIMRNIFALVLTLACLSVQSIFAQEPGFHYGARFGLGESFFKPTDAGDVESKLLIMGGIASNYQFNDFFGLTADFLISSKGARLSSVTTEKDVFNNDVNYYYRDRYDFIYAEIPIMAKFSIGLGDFKLKAFGGPTANFKLIAVEQRTYEDSDYNEENGYSSRNMDGVDVLEYGVVYGGGVDIITGNEQIIFLDFRVSNSLSSFAKINGEEVKNIYYAISAGYMF